MQTNIYGFIKVAKSEKAKKLQSEANEKVRKLIAAYEKAPSENLRNQLADALQQAQDVNPLRMKGGYYNKTRMTNDRANEMLDRGNVIRGSLGKVSTPFIAVAETLLSPVRFLSRLASPYNNIGFDDPKEIKLRTDPKEILRSAKELADLNETERPDPTSYFENVKTFTRGFKSNTAQAIGDSLLRVPASFVAPHNTPLLGEVAMDLVAAPSTALLDVSELNGSPRDEYEDAMIEEALNKKKK